MSKEIKNQYGVKIGDIFYLDKNQFIKFFQVVALKGKSQVTIKEVELEKVGEDEYKKDLVIPHLNHFKTECLYIEDNNIGASKTIKKHDDGRLYISFNDFFNRNPDGTLFQKLAYYQIADLWDGQPKVHYLNYY